MFVLRTFVFTFIVFIAFGSISAYSEILSSGQTDVTKKVAKIISFFDSPQGKEAWPGFHLSTGPTIIYFGSNPFIAFDFKTSDSSWIQVKELEPPAMMSQVDRWNLAHASSVSLNIENQLAYIFDFGRPDKINDEELGTFLHERFHRFQFETFENLPSHTVFLDHFNIEQLALTLLENQMLLKSIHDVSMEALKDIICIHTARVQLLKPESLEWERWQQRIEGTADYIETRTFTLLPIIKSTTPLLQVEVQAKKLFHYRGLIDSSIKWRHYPVGNILGILLDKLGPQNWKEQVAHGLGPMDIAGKLVQINPNEFKRRLIEIKDHFNFTLAQNIAETEVGKYQADLKAVDGRYSQDSGAEINFLIPPQMKCSGGGGRSERTYFLPDGSTLDLGRGASWRCESKSTNALITLKSVPISYPGILSRFKIEQTALMEIDGHHSSIGMFTEEKSQPFHSLSINGRTAIIEVNGSGTISFFKRGLLITLGSQAL